MKKTLSIKENNGITLIALVITIVVLIILAAVAINLSLGNNGIFNRAKTAKEQYSNAQIQEKNETDKLKDDINSYVSGHREVTDEEIENKIKNVLDNYYQKQRSDTYEEVSFINGNRYTAPSDGYFVFASHTQDATSNWIIDVDHFTKNGVYMSRTSGGGYSHYWGGGEIYMKKGDYIIFNKQANTKVDSSKFFYAVGCEPDTTE